MTHNNCAYVPQRTIMDIPGPTMTESLVLLAKYGFRKHHIFVEEMFQRYGPIFRHSLPGARYIYVSDPSDIEQVFRSEEENRPYRGDIILTQYAERKGLELGLAGDDKTWLKNRQLIAPKLLRLDALRPYYTEMLNVANDTIDNFKDGENENMQDHLFRWAAESMGVILFGIRIGTNYKELRKQARAFICSVENYFKAETKLFFNIPLHKYFMTPQLKKTFEYFDEMISITTDLAAETRKRINSTTKNCMVTKLEEDDKVNKDYTMFIVNNLFLAAIHTTGSSTLHLLHALSEHPDVQEKAYDEIKNILGTQYQQPCHEQLSQFKYVRAVIKEGFRYNSTPLGNMRVTKSPICIKGYQIAPGTNVVMSTVASKEMQQQKYGDPERFAPERWLRDTEKADIHPFSSLPFSFGKRSCAGKRVVEMEKTLLLIRLLQKYKIVKNKDRVNWIFNVLVTPDRPYTMQLKKRQ